MATLFLQYPACSTCQKAKKWLTENNIEFTNRLIVEENPTVEELKAWIPAQRSAGEEILQHERISI